MSLVSAAFPVPVIPAMPFAVDDWPQAGTSAHRPAVSTSAVTPASRIIRVFCIFIPLGPFLDPVDVVGDETVRLPVNVGRGLRRRRLDQAEHAPGSFVDPVPEVPDVVSRLRLQIGKVSFGDVPFSRRKYLHDRKVARSAGSSGKLPELPAAVAQIRGRSTYIGRAARRRDPLARATGRPARLTVRPPCRIAVRP